MTPTLNAPPTETDVLTVQVIRLQHGPKDLPEYATPGSAGMDIRAAIVEPVTLQPMERQLIPTGLIMQLPEGYECQIRPRSGLSIKHGITLVNCVGTIDSDYRDEIKVPIINLSQQSYTIEPGERIAQIIIAPVTRVMLHEIASVVRVEGRSGGFGSTGKV